MYFIILFSLLSLNVFSNDWWTSVRTEDESSYYYVGVSEGKRGLSLLQDEAFNKAMGELVREHFGMSIQINESAVEQMKKQQFNVVTKQSSAPLFIKGVKISKTREKDLDEKGSRIYVQIQADKRSIEEAIQNQTSKPGNDSLNTFGESHDSKVDISIKTHPQGALIHFSHMDRRFTLQGQGDARFYLPRGRYQMVVSHPGFATVKKEIKLEAQGNEENIILDELSGAVDLEVYPDDARIYYEGEKLTPGKYPVTINKIHKFTITHPDFFTHEVEFMLESPETLHKVVKLEPKPSTVGYQVFPSNAKIFIDDKLTTFYKGKTNVDPGKKRVVISAPGYFSYKEDIYVGTNREYPLKVVKLILDDENMPPSNKRMSVRAEINPIFGVANVGYGGLGLGLHLEYYYISVGAGFNYTQYTETEDNTNSIDNSNKKELEKSVSDGYLTARLITPQFGPFKFFVSGTYGQYSRSIEDSFNKVEIFKQTKSYSGIGGGFRTYITPKWSFHAEYMDVKTKDKETKVVDREYRFLSGFSYEF